MAIQAARPPSRISYGVGPTSVPPAPSGSSPRQENDQDNQPTYPQNQDRGNKSKSSVISCTVSIVPASLIPSTTSLIPFSTLKAVNTALQIQENTIGKA